MQFLPLASGRYEFSLRPRWRAVVFLAAIAFPSLLLAVKCIRIAVASSLGESAELSHLRRAASLDPDNPELLHKMGLLYSYSPDDFDPLESLSHLRRAAELNPNKSSYWVDVASVCESMGNTPCADQDLERALTLSPMNPRLYWATANYYLRTGRPKMALPRFRRLLEMSPEYASPTFDICLRMLGDTQAILYDVLPEGNNPGLKLAYVNFLIAQGKGDFAHQVWTQTLANVSRFPVSLAEPYLEALLARGNYQEARSVWEDLERLGIVEKPAVDDQDNLVFNGNFEQLPLNAGFDWRYQQLPYVSIDFSNVGAYTGHRCLTLNFTVSQNEEEEPVYQIVPVTPNQDYLLTAHVRSENITSDSGPRLRVSGFDCPNCQNLSSETTVGTTGWHSINLRFSTGPHTYFLRLSIWRPRSRAFPTEITGHFWIDAVCLKLWKNASAVPKAEKSASGPDS